MTQQEQERAEIARQQAKRDAGICTLTGCSNPHENRTLGRCREHGGSVAIPAQAHRARQAPFSRFWR